MAFTIREMWCSSRKSTPSQDWSCDISSDMMGETMLTLRLPDGSQKQVGPGTTPRQVAEGIGKRLAQAAIAAVLDGQIMDLDRELPGGNGEHTFRILTEKDPESLGVLRHSSAHVMARAVMRLFPGVQLAFGPVLENGFYYDIDSPTPIRE